jgi:hypothetical protein
MHAMLHIPLHLHSLALQVPFEHEHRRRDGALRGFGWKVFVALPLMTGLFGMSGSWEVEPDLFILIFILDPSCDSTFFSSGGERRDLLDVFMLDPAATDVSLQDLICNSKALLMRTWACACSNNNCDVVFTVFSINGSLAIG